MNLLTSFVVKPRRFALHGAVVGALVLQACGGGGGGDSAPVIDQMSAASQERAIATKLAAVMLYNGPYSPEWSIQATGIDFLTARFVSSATSGGCLSKTVNNADGLLGAGDSSQAVGSNCTLSHASGGSLTQSYTYNHLLVDISSRTIDPATAWAARHTTNSSVNLNYSFKATSGLTFDGTSLRTKSAAFDLTALGGNQAEAVTYSSNEGETSSRGNSSFSVNATMSCTYSLVSTAGQCNNYSATLAGTVYGRSISATFTPSAADPKVASLSYGGTSVTVRLVSQATNPRDDVFTLTTAAGETFNLSGEDVMWLAGGL